MNEEWKFLLNSKKIGGSGQGWGSGGGRGGGHNESTVNEELKLL